MVKFNSDNHYVYYCVSKNPLILCNRHFFSFLSLPFQVLSLLLQVHSFPSSDESSLPHPTAHTGSPPLPSLSHLELTLLPPVVLNGVWEV